MPINKTIDELVDKAIDDYLEKSDTEEEIKRRKPKPFRYLKKEEIQAELSPEESAPISVMKEPTTPQITDDDHAILGLGDLETIENVLKKHGASRKFKG